MDDDYDLDDYDDLDLDDESDFDEDEADDQDDSLNDYEVELAGSLDGESDIVNRMPIGSGYGSSLDFDKLSDEQKDLYDNAYYSSHGPDDFEDDGFDDDLEDDF